MINTYENLHLCVLDKEAHERTCGYWYTVREGGFAHTAFRSRDGLIRWLGERGLYLTEPLTDAGVHSYQRIEGAYRSEMHYHDDEITAWENLKPILVTRTLSNGDYTEARITLDADGIRTVHTLNPNIRTRSVFNYQESNRMMDGGTP